MDDKLFDQIADAELSSLERALGDFDPDELEVEMSSGVLSLTVRAADKIVINSHRAAGQIWMAAYRQAWHFDPHDEDGAWRWRTASEELRATLARILSEKLGRVISL